MLVTAGATKRPVVWVGCALYTAPGDFTEFVRSLRFLHRTRADELIAFRNGIFVMSDVGLIPQLRAAVGACKAAGVLAYIVRPDATSEIL